MNRELDQLHTYLKRYLRDVPCTVTLDEVNDRIDIDIKSTTVLFHEQIHAIIEPQRIDQSVDTAPPRWTEWLLYCGMMLSDDADVVVGDFKEKYHKLVAKYGRKKANRRYWREVLRSTIPIFVCEFRKLLGLIEWFKSLFG